MPAHELDHARERAALRREVVHGLAQLTRVREARLAPESIDEERAGERLREASARDEVVLQGRDAIEHRPVGELAVLVHELLAVARARPPDRIEALERESQRIELGVAARA